MRIFVIMLLLTISGLKSEAQKNGEKSPQSCITSQSEKDLAIKLFKEKYVKKDYTKFNGKIKILSKDTFQFMNHVIIVLCDCADLKAILKDGLLYPTLMSNDTIKISNFHEEYMLSSDPKIKRYSFWLTDKHILNPTVYFIELTNLTADLQTNTSTFLTGASLTFIAEAWIII